MKIKEPGDLESYIPVWGSGKASIHHFQQGNWARGALYAGMAASDLFLLKSLGTIGVRLAVKGGMALAGKGGSNLVVKGSVAALKRAPGMTKRQAATMAKEALNSSNWKNLGERGVLGMKYSSGPGAQAVQINGWWVKRVNPNANLAKRAWGTLSIEAQEQGLARLGPNLATDFFVRDGMLFTRDVGKEIAKRSGDTFWRSVRGSWRMKTVLTDIRPGNMGLNGNIFDPALDPVQKAFIWGVLGGFGDCIQDSWSARQ